MNIGKKVEQQELLSSLVRMHNSTASLEDNLAVSYKTKRRLTLQSSSLSPGCLPKQSENISPQTHTHTHTKPCKQMPTVVLFIIAPNWKQPWISELWHFPAM